MTLHPTVGQLDPKCKQATWWQEVYGSLEVPLRSFVPHMATGPDDETREATRFYYVDLARLTAEQIEKICQIMSREFGLSIDEVRVGVHGDHGVPVLAQHLTSVTCDARYLL